ncbi:hypothetical protein H9P43_001873 [Blastocladiella emersonii ATCC 22665]|nr:hypothetical protein H9P43_001873 [Blastocladiella emersonii ATCC 22665]
MHRPPKPHHAPLAAVSPSPASIPSTSAPPAWDDFLTRGANGKNGAAANNRRGPRPGPRRIDPKHHVEPLSVVGTGVGPNAHPHALNVGIAVTAAPAANGHGAPGKQHLAPLPTIAGAVTLPPLVKKPLLIGNRKLIFVGGGPGSGKGEGCLRLAAEFNLTHLSAGDLLRAEVARGTPIGAELSRMMTEGQLVPMSVTIQLLRNAMEAALANAPDHHAGFLIDGFPRELDQALAFEDALSLSPDAFLFLDCPLPVLEARLLKRGETSGRADDNMETIRKRFNTFVTQSMPVVDHYRAQGKVIEISSVHALDVVYAIIRGSVIARFPDWAPPSALAPVLAGRPLIFILGGPGSGKQVNCEHLRELYTLTHLSVGDLLRAEVARGGPTADALQECMRTGKIVPMETTLALVRAAIEASPKGSNGFLIDGFPREIGQAVAWERTMGTPDAVLFYDCPLSVLEARLLERGKTSGRADDNLDTIRLRFETYTKTSMPVVEYHRTLGRVATIKSDVPIDAVRKASEAGLDGILAKFGRSPLPKLTFKNVIMLSGGPGAGKGCGAQALVAAFHYVHLSTGDLLRAEVAAGTPTGGAAAAIMQDGDMVPMDMIRTLLLNAMRAHADAPGFIIDGYPRTLEQAKDIALLVPPRFVIYYEVPTEVLVQRLLKRGETSGRADDNAETIKKRIDTFLAATMPVIEYFANMGVVHKIDGTRSIDEVAKDTLALFEA